MRLLAAHFWRFHGGFGGIGLIALAVVLALMLPVVMPSDEKQNDKKS